MSIREDKIFNYFKYAIGEIVLVVIGILIALQINNKNDIRKERVRELHYLENIRTDLKINILEMDKYLARRTGNIEAATRILSYFEGEPITDYQAFNEEQINIYTWQRFYQNNNTFQELTNSGNIALIKNDSIKTMLLDIESLYKVMKAEEDHYRFDTETLLYEPIYEMLDLNPMVESYAFRASNGQTGKNRELTKKTFEDFFKNIKLKNGFVMTVAELTTINGMFVEMKEISVKLISTIDQELKKE